MNTASTTALYNVQSSVLHSRPYLPIKLKPLADHIQQFLDPLVTQPPFRYAILHGGRGSGKSTGIAILILICCLAKKIRVLCIREFQASLTDSCHQLFCDLIYDLGFSNHFETLNNKITCISTQSTIIFKGCSRNPQSLKSMEGIDIVWGEEAQTFSSRTMRLLIPTIRKSQSFLILSLNPENESDPVYSIYLDDSKSHFQGNKPDVLTIQLNWPDNKRWTRELERERKALQETDIEEYDHVYEGKCRYQSADVIYVGKVIEATFEVPRNAFFYQGLDFGDTHPFAFVRCFIEHETNTLFICEEAGGSKVDIDEYPDHLKHVKEYKRWLTTCDSAQPGSIRKLKQLGLNVDGTDKAHAQVDDGIRFIRSFKRIVVHPRCKQTLFEFKNYKYKKDPKTDIVSPIIIKESDHWMDALRYALNKLIMQSVQSPHEFKSFIGTLK